MSEYNAADTKAIRRALKAAKQAETERQGVIYNLMSSPVGRTFVYERLVRCHIFSSSFNVEPIAMAFAEGERNVGLQDLNDIMQFAPDQYVQMMREANERRITSDGRSGPGQDHGRDSSGPDDGAIGSVASEYDPGDYDDPGDGPGPSH